MKLAMVFPGQGSQSVGMVKGYAGLPEVEAVVQEAREALGDDFIRLLDEGPAEQLNLTVNTQPAMVTASGLMPRRRKSLATGEIIRVQNSRNRFSMASEG